MNENSLGVTPCCQRGVPPSSGRCALALHKQTNKPTLQPLLTVSCTPLYFGAVYFRCNFTFFFYFTFLHFGGIGNAKKKIPLSMHSSGEHLMKRAVPVSDAIRASNDGTPRKRVHCSLASNNPTAKIKIRRPRRSPPLSCALSRKPALPQLAEARGLKVCVANGRACPVHAAFERGRGWGRGRRVAKDRNYAPDGRRHEGRKKQKDISMNVL